MWIRNHPLPLPHANAGPPCDPSPQLSTELWCFPSNPHPRRREQERLCKAQGQGSDCPGRQAGAGTPAPCTVCGRVDTALSPPLSWGEANKRVFFTQFPQREIKENMAQLPGQGDNARLAGSRCSLHLRRQQCPGINTDPQPWSSCQYYASPEAKQHLHEVLM